MANLPLDLIDTNRLDARQVPVLASPGNGHLYRTEYVIPSRTKGFGNLLPTKPLGPTGQKPGIGLSQSMLSLRPGHPLYLNTARRAVNPAWRIEKNSRLSCPYGHPQGADVQGLPQS